MTFMSGLLHFHLLRHVVREEPKEAQSCLVDDNPGINKMQFKRVLLLMDCSYAVQIMTIEIRTNRRNIFLAKSDSAFRGNTKHI
jgi:hypothetical protein